MIPKAGSTDDRVAGGVLFSYFTQFVAALRRQLEEDDARWGDTWMGRPLEGQEERTKARFQDYFDQYEAAGTPVPWLKVAGGAFICWVRELREISR